MVVQEKSRQQLYQEAHPEQVTARKTLYTVMAKGKLVNPGFCLACESSDFPVEAHHLDYNFPLLVVWLCHRCHMLMHWGSLTPAMVHSRPPKPGQSQRPLTLCRFCRNQIATLITKVNGKGYLDKREAHLCRVDSRGHCEECTDKAAEWAYRLMAHTEATQSPAETAEECAARKWFWDPVVVEAKKRRDENGRYIEVRDLLNHTPPAVAGN